jgi:hypothetical protein
MDKSLSNGLFTYRYEIETWFGTARTTARLRCFSDLGQIARTTLPKGRPSIR